VRGPLVLVHQALAAESHRLGDVVVADIGGSVHGGGVDDVGDQLRPACAWLRHLSTEAMKSTASPKHAPFTPHHTTPLEMGWIYVWDG
jgi:hypothetical protein